LKPTSNAEPVGFGHYTTDGHFIPQQKIHEAVDVSLSNLGGYRQPYDITELLGDQAKTPPPSFKTKVKLFFVKCWRRLLPPPRLEDLPLEDEAPDVARLNRTKRRPF
jgi:hypothetical protein